ncbi:hypothetical protein QQS21_011355 [Conoideocrella luteorostrata]|uniref:Uncharacterized protein n=1 Tax=Conoideocrella luteorostrata TaxID=1105319 RepID=A0AAJ0CG16_9HYPO|nr:hypothetical protein QQS21_011355 [Conoideocrella luteorostrata]
MPQGHSQLFSSITLLTFTLFSSLVSSEPIGAEIGFEGDKRDNNPLHINWNPAPSPEDGPAFSAGALRDTKYLPAQIGGIVAAYGVSLVLVAITLLSLAKKRREHIQAGNEELQFEGAKELYGFDCDSPTGEYNHYLPHLAPKEPARNFPFPTPLRTQFDDHPLPPPQAPYIYPSPTSTCSAPGVDPSVDQAVVSADREMAQSQLEEMYKHVMEHDEAKQRGIVLDTPIIPGPSQRASSSDKSVTSLSRKDRTKPATLNLSAAHEDKTQSRTSSFFASLRSPRKKPVKGVNISSPIMTPQSATFPRHESQEMRAIPPRNYAPAPPPPIPTNQVPFGAQVRNNGAPPTPNMSPESIQSIDERITAQLGPSGQASQAAPEVDPVSASSEHSQTPLVRLPTTPKPGARFPTLPSSPKPGATFSRANPPSAVRTGGNLPLRAYEPAMSSPSATSHTTKQTVFERRGPLSPTTGKTPMTAGAVPYSPYQPFTPVVPITPSLVTKEDRRRMRRMVPKTPTLEMVKGSDEMW